MSRSTSHSPSSHRRGAHGGGGSDEGHDGGGGGGGGGPLVKVAFARNQAEAELLQGLLLESDVPSVLKRSRGFDNPDFLAAGPHDVYVSSHLAAKAREVLAETMVAEGEDPEWTALEEETRLGGSGETSPGRLAFWILTVFFGGLALAWLLYQLS
ncbi:MAG TPA: hypothetical protein VFR04_05220 [Solirubrobacterales bacterium]|nr:hypothetical protein [Solirubrobacterales bacterium]